MKSDDPEKDALLEKLWDLMLEAYLLDPSIIQAVCSDKGYYDIAVMIRDYDKDFIEGCLIEAWETVRGLAQTKANDLPF